MPGMNKQMLHRKATRHARVQFRAADDVEGRFVARVINYDVVDDYRTIFAPGVFTESLQQRLPRIVWSHDWSEPLGRYIEYRDSSQYLELVGEFDDFDDVPRARQAYAQLKSGTIDEFSVGFMPEAGEEVMIDEQYYFKFTRARLDEVSLVLAGAVPGTQLLAVRNRITLVRAETPTIPKDLAAQTILDLHSGKIDLADALQLVKNPPTSTEYEEPAEEPPAEEPPAEEPPAEEPAAEEPAAEPPADIPTDPEPTPGDTPGEEPGEEPDFSDLDDIDSILLTNDIGV